MYIPFYTKYIPQQSTKYQGDVVLQYNKVLHFSNLFCLIFFSLFFDGLTQLLSACVSRITLSPFHYIFNHHQSLGPRLQTRSNLAVS